jgi:glycosyltransferase involved in cell wall biosynthesis
MGRLIDVVICTYDNARSLATTLHSLENQRGAEAIDWAVLVVENNCSDDTGDIVQQSSRRATVPVRSVQEPHQGLTPARRRGVAETDGHWIAFVDDDCVLAPDWIASLAAVINERPCAGAIGGEVRLVWEREPPQFLARFGWAYAAQGGTETERRDALVGAGLAVRREALTASGWTRRQLLADRVGERLVSGGDVEIVLRLAVGHDLWYDPRLCLEHRLRADRAAFSHARRLIYGLGISHVLGESMRWDRGSAAWLAHAAAGSLRLARLAYDDIRAGSRRSALLRAAFLAGWLSGLLRMTRMSGQERRALIGLAAPPRGRP